MSAPSARPSVATRIAALNALIDGEERQEAILAALDDDAPAVRERAIRLATRYVEPAVLGELVADEANAIRTAYLRSDFLPEPDRAEAKGLLRRYVDVRLTLARSGNMEPAQVKHVLSETHRIQGRLWDMAVVNARQDMNSDVAALYIDVLNEVIGMQALRAAIGIQARVPGAIWLVLYGITILGMMGVGYQSGIAGSKRSTAGPILALAFAMVFALIASLDRPGSGVITVTQQPLIDLRDSMGTDAVSGER